MISKLITHLINKGVVIEISKDSSLGVKYDLNLRSKSWMYLYEKDNKWLVDMRYNTTIEITDIRDLELTMKELAEAAADGVHGRSFIDGDWLNIILEHDMSNPLGCL